MSRPLAPAGVHVPTAGPDSVYCTLYHRDPGFVALAEAELQALGGGSSAEAGIWLSPAPIRWASCGFGSAGGRQLAAGATLDALAEALVALKLAAPRFSLVTRCVPRQYPGSTDAKNLVGECIDGAVSMETPQLRLLLIVSETGYRLLIEEEAAPGEADWLGASHKPHNYMVALPVRIARAMLNITARPGDSVFDPFCGSGTIPLLAAWSGHPAFGSDISAACVAHAAENVAHFGLKATLVQADARETRQTADCIVSNPPYGVYSHVARDTMREILRNLAPLSRRATLVTSARLEDELRAEGYQIVQVIAVESKRFERFVYVTTADVPGPSEGSR